MNAEEVLVNASFNTQHELLTGFTEIESKCKSRSDFLERDLAFCFSPSSYIPEELSSALNSPSILSSSEVRLSRSVAAASASIDSSSVELS